jgi:hypothetical protein
MKFRWKSSKLEPFKQQQHDPSVIYPLRDSIPLDLHTKAPSAIKENQENTAIDLVLKPVAPSSFKQALGSSFAKPERWGKRKLTETQARVTSGNPGKKVKVEEIEDENVSQRPGKQQKFPRSTHLSLYLCHGDILIMVRVLCVALLTAIAFLICINKDGESIQKYYEHSIEPMKGMRFAITARKIGDDARLVSS